MTSQTHNSTTDLIPNSSEIIFYQSGDGQTRVECRFVDGSIWLTQAMMGELFQTTAQNITLHIKNIYSEGELLETATCKDYLQVRREGNRSVQRTLKHYNLEAILAVGYRVQSPRGTQFRQWATALLEEYLRKGFAMDDQRLKENGGGPYFDDLLARIRDIRSSEKVFWRKVLDIYATSIDYDPRIEATQTFFKTIQNKMHWAAHGHTAAEIIAKRADAQLPTMGLTSWTGRQPHRADVGIAKNYLNQDELETLNGIVTAYLEFAEVMTRQRRPMHMADWISKLDDFLSLSRHDILTHAGKLSHDAALAKAEAEWEKHHQVAINLPSSIEKDFDLALNKIKALKTGSQPDTKRKPKKS